MAKTNTMFFCQNCGFESTKWMGQCPGCKEWNSFVEEKICSSATQNVKKAANQALISKITDVSAVGNKRISTTMSELDRVLGGGIVPGSLILVGGDPGIGKSTLLLQVCNHLAQNQKVLYISGEESLQQIKIRAERLGVIGENLFLLCETSLEVIEEIIEKEKPNIVIVDSIQTMFAESVSAAPGSVTQVRAATTSFMQIAKGKGVTVFLVGHVTKEGTVAGPRVLEHMVDTVLYFEGDRHASYRVLRSVKNRFGSTNEIGVFEMRDKGLVEVSNPSEYMLDGKPSDASGSVVACSLEGTRPVLLEVQALVCQSNLGIPRRTSVGTDINRVNLLMAVLEKRGGLHLSNCDAYINIAGGLKMNEPALDLAIAFALISSYKDVVIDEKILCFGEIGLSGEVRSVSQGEIRIKEAKKLGFQKCILPESMRKALSKEKGIELIGVENVRDILKIIR